LPFVTGTTPHPLSIGFSSTQDDRQIETSELAGVSDNRLQNVVITLDKVKLCLGKPGQPLEAPLVMMSAKDIINFLWTGDICMPIPCANHHFKVHSARCSSSASCGEHCKS
jgi:hypothetical protein